MSGVRMLAAWIICLTFSIAIEKLARIVSAPYGAGFLLCIVGCTVILLEYKDSISGDK